MSDAVVDETQAEPAQESNALAGLQAHAKRLASTSFKPRRVALQIDGLRYASTKLPALVGLDLWGRLVAVLGVDLLRAAVTGTIDGVSMDALTRAAVRASQLDLPGIVRELMALVEVDQLAGLKAPGNVSDDLDDHFAGEYLHLLKVCQFVLAHNLLGPCRGGR